MSSTNEIAGEPEKIDNYVALISPKTEVDKKYINDDGCPAKIIYFCQDCKEPTTPKRIGKKFQFSCAKCKGKQVAFGSETSVVNYYKRSKDK